jgi:hypothetical protein
VSEGEERRREKRKWTRRIEREGSWILKEG